MKSFLSVSVCGIGPPPLRAPNSYETSNPADVCSRIRSQLSSDLVSAEVRLSSYGKALSPIPCCLGLTRPWRVSPNNTDGVESGSAVANIDAPTDARSVAATLQDGITLADDDLHNDPKNDYLKYFTACP